MTEVKVSCRRRENGLVVPGSLEFVPDDVTVVPGERYPGPDGVDARKALVKAAAAAPNGTCFSVPVAGIGLLRALTDAVKPTTTLLLAGDKSYEPEELQLGSPPPALQPHGNDGCWSVAVQMHQLCDALATVSPLGEPGSREKFAVHADQANNVFDVSALALGSSDDRVCDLARAHRLNFGCFVCLSSTPHFLLSTVVRKARPPSRSLRTHADVRLAGRGQRRWKCLPPLSSATSDVIK